MLTLLLVAVALIVGLRFLPDEATTVAAPAEPGHIEAIKGSEISRVRLSAHAAQRIALRTVAVRKVGKSMAVPYSAVLYDSTGKTWVYASPEKLAFVRVPVVVRSIDGQRALLSRGPKAGTRVASVGAAELYGTEFEVGH
jgi:hypothetical protein